MLARVEVLGSVAPADTTDRQQHRKQTDIDTDPLVALLLVAAELLDGVVQSHALLPQKLRAGSSSCKFAPVGHRASGVETINDRYTSAQLSRNDLLAAQALQLHDESS